MYCATPALLQMIEEKRKVLREIDRKGREKYIWGGRCLLAGITIVALNLARILVEFAVLVRTDWMEAQVIV